MTSRRTLGIVFICSLFSVALSLSWLVTHVVDNVGLIFTEPIYSFVLTISCLSFFITFVSLHGLLVDKRRKTNEVREKEKNVRDFHQYHQLLNPPDMDT